LLLPEFTSHTYSALLVVGACCWGALLFCYTHYTAPCEHTEDDIIAKARTNQKQSKNRGKPLQNTSKNKKSKLSTQHQN
jgi:hypothetical protein